MDTDAIEFPKARIVWCHIPQTGGEQDTSRFIRPSVLSESPKVIFGNSLNAFDATFQNQSTLICDLIAPTRQEFLRRDSVMAQEAMNAMSVLVARAVMVKRQRTMAVAR
jgi:hypothetical protein